MKILRETASKDLLFFRDATGMSQERLAEKTGVSKNTIISIENDTKGEKKIKSNTLFKLNTYIENIA